MAAKRAIASVVVGAIGTGVLLLLSGPLDHLVWTPWMLVGCFLGACGSTWCSYNPTRVWVSALWIVAATLPSIALGAAIAELVAGGGARVLEHAALMTFWEILATSWWLVPCTALILWALNRAFIWMDRTSPPRAA